MTTSNDKPKLTFKGVRAPGESEADAAARNSPNPLAAAVAALVTLPVTTITLMVEQARAILSPSAMAGLIITGQTLRGLLKNALSRRLSEFPAKHHDIALATWREVKADSDTNLIEAWATIAKNYSTIDLVAYGVLYGDPDGSITGIMNSAPRAEEDGNARNEEGIPLWLQRRHDQEGQDGEARTLLSACALLGESYIQDSMPWETYLKCEEAWRDQQDTTDAHIEWRDQEKTKAEELRTERDGWRDAMFRSENAREKTLGELAAAQRLITTLAADRDRAEAGEHEATITTLRHERDALHHGLTATKADLTTAEDGLREYYTITKRISTAIEGHSLAYRQALHASFGGDGGDRSLATLADLVEKMSGELKVATRRLEVPCATEDDPDSDHACRHLYTVLALSDEVRTAHNLVEVRDCKISRLRAEWRKTEDQRDTALAVLKELRDGHNAICGQLLKSAPRLAQGLGSEGVVAAIRTLSEDRDHLDILAGLHSSRLECLIPMPERARLLAEDSEEAQALRAHRERLHEVIEGSLQVLPRLATGDVPGWTTEDLPARVADRAKDLLTACGWTATVSPCMSGYEGLCDLRVTLPKGEEVAA